LSFLPPLKPPRTSLQTDKYGVAFRPHPDLISMVCLLEAKIHSGRSGPGDEAQKTVGHKVPSFHRVKNCKFRGYVYKVNDITVSHDEKNAEHFTRSIDVLWSIHNTSHK
jgi:hypothetical protein